MKITLGVSGGIAAYKAAEIVRHLQDRGVRVQVVMTAAAQEFVRPLTFAALSLVSVAMFGLAPWEGFQDSYREASRRGRRPIPAGPIAARHEPAEALENCA